MPAQFHSSVSVNELQRDAPTVLDKLRVSNRPTAITRGKRAAAVLMTIEAYERAERERSLLLRLAKGEAEIAAGVGYDLEAVLADADRLLRPARP